MKGTDIIDALLRKLRVSTDTELAATLGITGQAIRNWRERKTIAPRQVAGLVHRGQLASRKEIYNSAIRPVVEFFRINKTIRRGIRRAACSSCARGRAARQNPAFAKGVQIRIGREKWVAASGIGADTPLKLRVFRRCGGKPRCGLLALHAPRLRAAADEFL